MIGFARHFHVSSINRNHSMVTRLRQPPQRRRLHQRSMSMFTGVRQFDSPTELMNDMLAALDARAAGDATPVRNYIGVITDMSRHSLVIETPLFPEVALDFYTAHNLCRLIDTPERDGPLYSRYYDAARGGGQGDYRDGLSAKIDNVVDCLTRFPQSKRAVLTVPLSNHTSTESDHTVDAEAKCLRELHFYIEDNRLHCTGLMRANAATIFPKNIHYIGTLQRLIADRLAAAGVCGGGVGSYTHFVTTLIDGRED